MKTNLPTAKCITSSIQKSNSLSKKVLPEILFGRLKTTGRYRNVIKNNKTRFEAEAVCVCGVIDYYDFYNLRIGKTKSCGCLFLEGVKNRFKTHGMSKSRAFKCWVHLRERCYDENNAAYHCYGGRGIKVCDRWLENFENFWEDMKDTYENSLTLDRIDVNGDYSKENCRWATIKQQARNRRNNIYITFQGETKLLIDWAVIFNIKESVLRDRYKNSWPTNKLFNLN